MDKMFLKQEPLDSLAFIHFCAQVTATGLLVSFALVEECFESVSRQRFAFATRPIGYLVV